MDAAEHGPVFLFPGQSSRARDMFAPLRARAPRRVASALEQASDHLGRDLSALDRDASDNRAVQVGVFLANHLHLTLLRDEGVLPIASAGLSLGEYNHLVAIGTLSFLDALAVIDARGRLYDEGPSGAMAAVFPARREELDAVLAEHEGALWVSNENSLTQHVIAGEAEAVERACAQIEETLYARAVVIERRIPMHTPRFAPVGARLRGVLESAAWRAPTQAHWSNVTAASTEAPSAETMVRAMTRHVSEPVRWCALVRAMAARHPDAPFFEVGPGTVVRDLFRRSGLDRACHATSTDEGWRRALQTRETEVTRAFG